MAFVRSLCAPPSFCSPGTLGASWTLLRCSPPRRSPAANAAALLTLPRLCPGVLRGCELGPRTLRQVRLRIPKGWLWNPGSVTQLMVSPPPSCHPVPKALQVRPEAALIGVTRARPDSLLSPAALYLSSPQTLPRISFWSVYSPAPLPRQPSEAPFPPHCGSLTRTPHPPLQKRQEREKRNSTRRGSHPPRSSQAHGRKSFRGPCSALHRVGAGRHSPVPAAPQRRRSRWPSARVTSLQRGGGPPSAPARQQVPPHCIALPNGGCSRRPLARPALLQPRPRPLQGPAPPPSPSPLLSTSRVLSASS
ncbi:proline-rich protein 2-like [Nannospalax galili]|uniref:proline-rich protein 2-like n=1 Tax=Nannospalax galili TaxID=1026970 RepID=UPI0004ED7249|nr:proline-rich protein 2-like [Nannospalax galili]